MELLISKSVDANVGGLELHDFLKVGLFPVASGRILVDAAPRWVNQIELCIQRLATHALGFGVAFTRLRQRQFDAVPVEVLLGESPTAILAVVISKIPFLQVGALLGRDGGVG